MTSWSNFTPSLPPTSTIEEVDNEDTISLGSNVRMTMEDIWDSVNEHLGLDMMDLITFGTFNEFGIKNVRATPSRIPKWVLCGVYKNSGLDEMRLMG